MLFGEMTPGRSHHWGALLSEIEVALLLVVLDISGLKNSFSSPWIVHEFTSSCGLEICWVSSKLVVSSYLVERILIAHELISREINWVLFLSEAFQLFSSEILAPWSGVVPMRCLQSIFVLFIDNSTILFAPVFKLTAIVGIISGIKASDGKIRLSHFIFFIFDIEIVSFSYVWWVMILSHTCFICGFYKN